MNTEGMNDNEKSVMLAKLCGWIRPAGDCYKPGLWIIEVPSLPMWSIAHFWKTEPLDLPDFDFYHPANMELAWRVLDWGLKVKPTDPTGSIHEPSRFHNKLRAWMPMYLWGNPKAQRLWLDKILSLAIEAGMVEVGE